MVLSIIAVRLGVVTCAASLTAICPVYEDTDILQLRLGYSQF